MRTLILSVAAASLVAGTLAQAAEGPLRQRLAERLAQRNKGPDGPKAPGKQTFSYGSDRLQQLDFYPAQNARGPAPLVLFVHGGGWKRGSKDNADGSGYASRTPRLSGDWSDRPCRDQPAAWQPGLCGHAGGR